jgi:molecular chaperone IbpA
METSMPMSRYARFPTLGNTFDLMDRMMDGATANTGGPAFNVVNVDDDHYRIVLAVPGYKEADLEIVSEPNRLTVSGKPQQLEAQGEVVWRGIAQEPFTRSWRLADFVRVESARLDDGLLTLELVREIPEELKPKKIQIAGSGQKAINQGEGQATH